MKQIKLPVVGKVKDLCTVKNNGSTFSSLMDPCLLRCTTIIDLNSPLYFLFSLHNIYSRKLN